MHENSQIEEIKAKGILGAQKSAAFPKGDPQRWRGETRGLQLKLFKIVHIWFSWSGDVENVGETTWIQTRAPRSGHSAFPGLLPSHHHRHHYHHHRHRHHHQLQQQCEVRFYNYTFFRYYSYVMPTHWRRMNTILTDIHALSTISSTFTGLVRRGGHIDKIISGEMFTNWGWIVTFLWNFKLWVGNLSLLWGHYHVEKTSMT